MNSLIKYIQPLPTFDYGEQPKGLEMEMAKSWVYSLQNEFRLYQFTILQTTFYFNTLVCLPTGLGKTFISAMTILNYSRWFPEGKIFFLAPTRPLVVQQQEAMKKFGIDGKLSKNDRSYQSQIYFSTPQTLDNDLNDELIDQIVLVVLDEAHKGVGDYAYTAIVKRLSYRTRIVGLSATPGNNIEQIQQVIANLRIAKIELKDENDPEVVPYLKFKKIEKIVVSFDNCQILDDLNKQMQPLLNIILSYEILPIELIRVCSRAEIFSYGSCFKMREFLMKAQLQFKIGSHHAQKVFEHLQHLHKLSYAKKILLEQGMQPYAKYMELQEVEEIHPKIAKLKEIFSEHFINNQSKVIVFTNSRDNAQLLCNHINQVENVRASIFVGQSSSKNLAGMKQKEQLEIINKFKTELNVLVATCIAEEGLDIGEVDLIICFDSGFSPIRMIQRMGRTGRKRDGKIIVLLTEGKETADYEKSVNKYSKLIKELKNSNLNYYSCNPRILSLQPTIWFIDGDITQIEIKLVLNDNEQKTTKTKNIRKQKSSKSQMLPPNQIKIENYFAKPFQVQQLESTTNKQSQQLQLIEESVKKTKKNTGQNKLKLEKIENFFIKKQKQKLSIQLKKDKLSMLNTNQLLVDEENSKTILLLGKENTNLSKVEVTQKDIFNSINELDLFSLDLNSQSSSEKQNEDDILSEILNMSGLEDMYKSDEETTL